MADLNSDFAKRVMLHSDELQWQPSPMPGVDRRRLDRVGSNDERVTTIVRYAADSHFSAHDHPGGEELFVIDGVFEDDYGHWPAGSYVRNPPGSSHTPGSSGGCIILVKLGQFRAEDRRFVHADLNTLAFIPHRNRPGVAVSPLYCDEYEDVRFERWEPGQDVALAIPGGAELFVISGGFEQAGDQLRRHSWLRMPVDSTIEATTASSGALLWIKTDHLRGL